MQFEQGDALKIAECSFSSSILKNDDLIAKENYLIDKAIGELDLPFFQRVKMKNQFQLYAYETLKLDFDIALKFYDLPMINAYKAGVTNVEDAIKFTSMDQVYAYMEGATVEDALCFNNPYQLDALKVLNTINADDVHANAQNALRIANYNQVEALKHGVPLEDAVGFIFPSQKTALVEFRLPYQEAKRFIYPTQIKALKHGFSVDDATKIVNEMQMTAIINGIDVDDAVSIGMHNQSKSIFKKYFDSEIIFKKLPADSQLVCYFQSDSKNNNINLICALEGDEDNSPIIFSFVENDSIIEISGGAHYYSSE